MKKSDFGPAFKWGISTAAYQIEGAYQQDGKGLSIWDVFTNKKGKTFANQNANIACDFYHKYPEDLRLLKQMNIPNFRFSISWSRVFPEGTGKVNQKGVAYYHNLIDQCLELGIEPWVTLYHWDLPFALHKKGGWTNREVLNWFSEYAAFCAKEFGRKVKYWMVLNEPVVFTGGGYFLGVHAPGIKKFSAYLKAVHHVALCQAEGGRVLRADLPAECQIGTTFSCSYIEPLRPENQRDQKATRKVNSILNRLFVEPALGMGYPWAQFKPMRKIQKYMQAGDEERLPFDFDFFGVQNYTREVVKHDWWNPLVNAKLVPPEKRGIKETTQMGWEVFPEAMYHMLKQFSAYQNAPKLIVSENGAAFPDTEINGVIDDPKRTDYIRENLRQVLLARSEGVPVEGYFVWTFTDNFEWAEGYEPRFGLVRVDFETQQRTIKNSGKWYADFLND